MEVGGVIYYTQITQNIKDKQKNKTKQTITINNKQQAGGEYHKWVSLNQINWPDFTIYYVSLKAFTDWKMRSKKLIILIIPFKLYSLTILEWCTGYVNETHLHVYIQTRFVITWNWIQHSSEKIKHTPGGCLNIKMSSYQYKDPPVKDRTVSWPSYL